MEDKRYVFFVTIIMLVIVCGGIIYSLSMIDRMVSMEEYNIGYKQGYIDGLNYEIDNQINEILYIPIHTEKSNYTEIKEFDNKIYACTTKNNPINGWTASSECILIIG